MGRTGPANGQTLVDLDFLRIDWWAVGSLCEATTQIRVKRLYIRSPEISLFNGQITNYINVPLGFFHRNDIAKKKRVWEMFGSRALGEFPNFFPPRFVNLAIMLGAFGMKIILKLKSRFNLEVIQGWFVSCWPWCLPMSLHSFVNGPNSGGSWTLGNWN